ncbi:hypothetical protein KFE25_012588 [Diacronema lutheri]|uniref:Uncharacterized protein n=1 Tax=Diacronema lutheri TaxID=2081491 RepID=A0A8J5XME8_DIALT|nr:hypothetical protein KFE25_012588 [Diacronema lutheri]|mmetsp:Transcript_7174/g.22641  ORF Transcript_7174/g.22641 Transcript_7174/m.22641 type:complete len:296 (-) Transcript_7174:1088-1975(-)
MRTFILAALAAAAQARGGSAPHVSSSGSTGQHCHTILSLNNDFSKLDVKGALNGHPIELSKKEEARPGGELALDMSIPCPTSNDDLTNPFTFTVTSVGSLLIYPQEDLTVMAAKVVSIEVDRLQISVRTPSPLSVSLTAEGPTFASTNGLEMTVTSGTATALKKSFDLTGFTATVPFNGYFVADDNTGELTLHLVDFDADFPVLEQTLGISGNFEVIGWLTALSGPAGRLVREHVQARVLEHAATSQGRRPAALAAGVGACALAALLVAAALRARRQAEAQPLRSSAQRAADSSA